MMIAETTRQKATETIASPQIGPDTTSSPAYKTTSIAGPIVATENTVQRSLDDYNTLLRHKATESKPEDEDGQ